MANHKKPKKSIYNDGVLTIPGVGAEAVAEIKSKFPLADRVRCVRVLFLLLTNEQCPPGTLGWFLEWGRKIDLATENEEEMDDAEIWQSLYQHLKRTLQTE